VPLGFHRLPEDEMRRRASAFILFPIGYPAEGCTVPRIEKKPLAEVVTWMEALPHLPGDEVIK